MNDYLTIYQWLSIAGVLLVGIVGVFLRLTLSRLSAVERKVYDIDREYVNRQELATHLSLIEQKIEGLRSYIHEEFNRFYDKMEKFIK